MEPIKTKDLRVSAAFNSIEQTLLPIVFLFLIIVLALGTCGYMIIEGWNTFDSLYMTVITIATVGFGEVHPLSHDGRVLTMALILLGVFLVVLATSAFTQLIFRREFLSFFLERRMTQALESVTNHVIVCGFGRMSKSTAKELAAAKTSVVVIDFDEDHLLEAKALGYLTVLGNASDEDVLEKAGVKRCQALVTLIPKDSENLYIVLAARELAPDVYIVSRAEDEFAEKRLLRAGANRIISPYRAGGQKIARAVLKPFVSELMELATQSSGQAVQIEELKLPRTSPLCGKSLSESEVRKVANIIVLSLVTPGGNTLFNPSANEKLEAGSTLITMGSSEELTKFENLLFGKSS